MSRSVDLFFDMEPPVEAVASELGRLTSFVLTPGEVPGTWLLEEGQIRAELHAHPYIDDGDLLLSRYRWALSCRVATGVRLADAAETTLLRLVCEALLRARIPALLVHDLQYRDAALAGTAAADLAVPGDQP